MLGETVREVSESFGPVDEEVTLANTIADPAVAHVHGFGSTLGDSVIGDTIRRAVVGLNRCRTLRIAHFI